MSASPDVEMPSVDGKEATTETAFSRFAPNAAPRRRRGYGSASLMTESSSPVDENANDTRLGDVKMSLVSEEQDHEVSLFASQENDDGKDASDTDADDESTVDMNMEARDDEVDHDDDESTVEMSGEQLDNDEELEKETQSDDEEAAEPVKRGRTKRSFPTSLELAGKSFASDETEREESTTKEAAMEEDKQNHESSADDHGAVEEETNQDSNSGDEAPAPTDEENDQETPEKESANKEETTDKEEPAKEQPATEPEAPKQQPDKESLITSIDNLFVHADKETVTVGDIVRSLEAEYDVKLEKATRKIVKAHLVDLIKGVVEPTVESSEAAEEQADDDESFQGDVESEASDYEEEVKKKPRRKAAPKKKRTSSRRTPAKKKPSHVRIHAEMLRKRRIEELRVRNEELQLKQSKEDQERAEKIAAKFETDTDELRLKRLEDRLDLLQKLDQKRIRVVSNESEKKEEDDSEKVEAAKEETQAQVEAETAKESNELPLAPPDEETDEDSDDDLELEIVGLDEPSSEEDEEDSEPPPKAVQTTAPVPVKSSALSMLDMVRTMKPSDRPKQSRTAAQTSPRRSKTARAALRNALAAKQKKAGNMWLARELGYKTEQEHLRDCMLVEQKKREDVLKKEEERQRANERKQLRERLIAESNPYAEEEGDPVEADRNHDESSGDAVDGANESDDEEMAMAREIEEEQREEETPREESDTPQMTEDEVPAPDESNDAEANGVTAGDDNDVLVENKSSHEAPAAECEQSPPSPSSDEGSPGEDVEEQAKGTSMDEDVTMETGMREEDGVAETEISEPNEQSIPSETESAPKEAATGVEKSESVGNSEDQVAKDGESEDDDEHEFQEDPKAASSVENVKDDKVNKDKNAGWKAILQKEAEKVKKMKAKKNGQGLVDVEADEEEEEEVAGLEDFGFSVKKKKKEGDEDEDVDKVEEEDMKHVVDDVSDDEGDEEAGETARMEQEKREEKERHKEIIRRMRDGYDGRRGGIAGGGFGARGVHRFDQLVAADNREDAKRLGLLNDDELDSDDDGENGNDANEDDEIEDENALLDKMLKDRFLHRSSHEELEENFSEDEEEEREVSDDKENAAEDEEEKEQERLAKRFAKRARMQRLIEIHGDDEEFSQLRLIDEDENTRLELKLMKSATRKPRTTSGGSSRASQSGSSDSQESTGMSGAKRQSNTLAMGTSSLSLALQASRSSKKRTSFLGGSAAGASKDKTASVHCVAMSHVVFNTGGDSQLSKGGYSSRSGMSNLNRSMGKRKRAALQTSSTSLWSKVSTNGFKKRR